MSDRVVDTDEMLKKRFSDRDVERLLSGQPPEDEQLAKLAPILRSLHKENIDPPSEERVTVFAVKAAEIAGSTKPQVAGRAAPAKSLFATRRSTLALKRKMATGLAAMLLISGMTGVAVASDEAAPGDALYEVDRALESLGLGDGGPAERIAEAQALFNDGLVAEAITHAAEAVEEDEDETEATDTDVESVEALRAAAEAVTSTDEGDADGVRERVAAMLTWMADNAEDQDGLTGKDFGQKVAELAGEISDEHNAADAAEDAADAAEDEADAKADALDKAADEAERRAEEAEEAEEAAEEAEEEASDDGEAPEGVPAGPPESVPTGPPEGTPGQP